MKRIGLIIFMLFCSSPLLLTAGVKIISPASNYKPLPTEELCFKFEKDRVSNLSLYYRTDIEPDWTMITDKIQGNEYCFTCPAYFFETIEFKLIQQYLDIPTTVLKESINLSEYPIALGRNVSYTEFSPDGKRFIACDENATLFVYDIATRKIFAAFEKKEGSVPIYRAKYDTDTNIVFCSYYEDGMQDLHYSLMKSDEKFSKYEEISNIGDKMQAGDMDIDADGNIVVATSKDSQNPTVDLLYYDKANGNTTYQDMAEGEIYSACFSADGTEIIYGNYQGGIQIEDTKHNYINSIEDAHGINGNSTPIWAIAASPNGQYIASGGVDAFVKVWNTEDYSLHREFAHTAQVRSLAFHKTKPYLLSGSLDKTVCEWDLETGEKLMTLENGFQVLYANYSPTGDSIICCGRSDSIKIWKRPKMLELTDSIAYESDYAGTIYMTDCSGDMGKHTRIQVMMEIDNRLLGNDFDTDIDVEIKIPKNIAVVAEFDTLNTVPFNITGALESKTAGFLNLLLLRSEMLSGRSHIDTFVVHEPEGAKFKIHDGDIKINELCYGSGNDIVFIDNRILINAEANNLHIESFQLKNGNHNVNIYNNQGQLCVNEQRTLSAGPGEFEIEAKNLSTGIYFLVIDDGQQQRKKAFLFIK